MFSPSSPVSIFATLSICIERTGLVFAKRNIPMDLASAKMIGAGLACIALVGAGVGIGNVFSALISAVARNPASQAQVQPFAFLGFALAEATGLFGLAIAFLILFVF
jgi:F0F1-type ATP synthase membrane subunit c/vacuolar-type H+-ATPase subunit K